MTVRVTGAVEETPSTLTARPVGEVVNESVVVFGSSRTLVDAVAPAESVADSASSR
jgi:hypothetical protein